MPTASQQTQRPPAASGKAPPRVLIEDWLPAAAIGVECMRERGSASALAPHTYLHVWWARRPLTAARAAVLGSVVPADFPRDLFERLVGFGRPSKELVDVRKLMDTGFRVDGGFRCDRAFKAAFNSKDLELLRAATNRLWGGEVVTIDPMSGGGSIPLESARLGFRSLANEYNPVACSILEATVDYPLRFGADLPAQARQWGKVWLERVSKRIAKFYPVKPQGFVHAYLFARTVPCPDTQFDTPLVPDWHVVKPKTGTRVVAVPRMDKTKGTWTCEIKAVGGGAGQIKEAPSPSYGDGKGVSLFSGNKIEPDYIKAMAEQGRMKSTLYAVALKTEQGLKFVAPDAEDLAAVARAEEECVRALPSWQRSGMVPTEKIPDGDKTGERWDTESRGNDKPLKRGQLNWTDLFSPRQLLSFGVMVEELRRLREELVKGKDANRSEAVIHLLAFVIDKFANYNCNLASWSCTTCRIRGNFDRHDYAYTLAWSEYAVCGGGEGLQWCIDNVTKASRELAELPYAPDARPAEVTLGSATNLASLDDKCVSAVVVDPPYADNVQYSELADFFYVWLKRTQGHRHPDWFSSYLCDHGEEAVVNVSRQRDGGKVGAKEAKAKAHDFYQRLMTDAFRESRRILRDDGVLTVMFTHKKQEAWEALFESLIRAGFTITATWPVKTESEHSLHQAKKNAAQSTVILVARKRPDGSGKGYFDASMQQEIRRRARESAQRLMGEGLNPVDQLVGSFGPAMEVFSRHDQVVTDTGVPVSVSKAIDEASDAVSRWRIEQLAEKGLQGVEAEGQFYLLCWDVLGAAEFRFNEAKLLGHAVGMDVEQLVTAGLVSKTSDKIKMLSVKERRRDKAIAPDKVEELLYGTVSVTGKKTKKQALKVHPNDPAFRTAVDGCHALALRHLEAGGGAGGVGNAKALARQQNWTKESPVARLMEALLHAAPDAVRFAKVTKKGTEDPKAASTQFPEFRAWHAMLEPLFGLTPPEWKQTEVERGIFNQSVEAGADESDDEEGEEDSDE